VIACTGAGASSAVFDITALMNTATSANTAGAIVQRDGSGNFVAGTVTAALTGNVTGNASTASAWQTARTFTINGVTQTVDGTSNPSWTLPAPDMFPAGGIIMWSGSVASIPTGWLLCDGANGTPNLQNRFIVGAGDTHAPGATGGADSVTLAEANLPSHTHSFSATTGGAGGHSHTGTTNTAGAHTHSASTINPSAGTTANTGFVYQSANPATTASQNVNGVGDHNHTFTTSTAADHTHTVSGTTGATGSGTAFDNRPAFYALAYIMKA
jgi:microcystin-dependent protein